jgi:hypothetical protein
VVPWRPPEAVTVVSDRLVFKPKLVSVHDDGLTNEN